MKKHKTFAALWATTALVSGLGMAGRTWAADPQATSGQDLMGSVTPAPISSPVSPPTAISFASTQGTTSASVKATFNFPLITPESQQTNTLGLTVTTPIAKNMSPTNFVTLDGFANSTSLAVQYSHFDVATDGAADVAENLQCAKDAAAALKDVVTVLELEKRPTEAAQNTLDAVTKSGVCPDDVLRPADLLSKLGFDVTTAPARLQDELSAWKADEQAAIAPHLRGRALIYGLTGQVGYEDHTWYNSATLAKATLTGVPTSGGVFFTYVGTGWKWAVTGQFQYQYAFTDGMNGTLCPKGTGILKCITGPIGSPKHAVSDLLSVELRDQIPIKWFGGSGIAIAPKVTYDANSGVYAVALPIYLFGDGKSLNGGIGLNWRSDTHDTAVGVFVTQPFSIPGQGAPTPAKGG